LRALVLTTCACASDAGTTEHGGAPTPNMAPPTASTLAVRCFDYTGDVLCFATPGTDNWAVAWTDCRIAERALDPAVELAGNPGEITCDGKPGAPDSLDGWDETLCFRHRSNGFPECYGKLDGFWLEIFADCSLADSAVETYVVDPAEVHCGQPSFERGGWDALLCVDAGSNDASARCYGRRGAYWVGPTMAAHYLNGLVPSCQLNSDGSGVEISVAEAQCPRLRID
jgi:hypothetical protein